MKTQHFSGEYGTVEVSWQAGNPEIVLGAIDEGDPLCEYTPRARMSVLAADLADDLVTLHSEGETVRDGDEDFPVVHRTEATEPGPARAGYAMSLVHEYGTATLLWIGRPTGAEQNLPTLGVRVLLSEQQAGALEDLAATIADIADANARIRTALTGTPATA